MVRQSEKKISGKEIDKVIKKLRMRKASGIDGIPMEAWKYAESGVKKKLKGLITQIWEEREILKNWRTNIIISLYKRGNKEEVGNYRGIFTVLGI